MQKQNRASSGNLMTTQEYFASLQQPITPRSSFDRGCEILTTLDAGYLVPIYWDEVLPSDTWKISTNIFARILTLTKPLMDNLFLDLHWFFVPNRIIHTDWVTLMGEQVDPANPVTVTVPQVVIDNELSDGTLVTSSDLGGYLGLPIGRDKLSVSAYPFRAYKKIYDDLYRDENHVAEQLPVSARGNADVTYNPTNFPLLRSFKTKDYFTSALPWAQKGTAPTLTLGSTAPVVTNNQNPTVTGAGTTNNSMVGNGTTINRITGNAGFDSAGGALVWGNETGMQVNLAASTGFTLNAFREFATLQQYLELDARAGTRYVETLQSQFGVQPEDARLQRAEYLGGHTVDLSITPIPQTAASGSTPQANLAGMGTMGSSSPTIVKSFTEDGIIMCIARVKSQLRYQQGLPRKWSRVSRYDFYRPVFANLGEQPIYNKELYCQDGDAGGNPNEAIFGYQEAWAEYRYSPSPITGKMNSDDPVSLDVWHLGQDFGSLPTLGRTFLEENPPMARVVAVTDEPAFQLNGAFKLNVARPMPMRSTPGLTKL